MDIHQIYSSWSLANKLPTEKHVQYFTVMEKPCELEFIAMLLRDAGQKVEVSPDPATMEKIPLTWSERVSDVFVINVGPENVELRVFLESIVAARTFGRTARSEASSPRPSLQLARLMLV